MKLMHGVMERGLGRQTHAVCTEDGKPLEMTREIVEELVKRWNDAELEVYMPEREMRERIGLLNRIVLSAIALKLNIEGGFPPTLHALNRDLGLYQVRFGGVVEMIGKAAVAIERPANFSELTPEQQWEIDKKLGILDREG